MKEKDIYKRAQKKAKEKKSFLISAITWALFSFYFIYLDTGWNHLDLDWSFYPIFFWGLGILIHGVKVFDFFGLGEKWEKDALRKELEKEGHYMEDFEEEDDLLDLDPLPEKRNNYRDSDFV